MLSFRHSRDIRNHCWITHRVLFASENTEVHTWNGKFSTNLAFRSYQIVSNIIKFLHASVLSIRCDTRLLVNNQALLCVYYKYASPHLASTRLSRLRFIFLLPTARDTQNIVHLHACFYYSHRTTWRIYNYTRYRRNTSAKVTNISTLKYEKIHDATLSHTLHGK